MENATVNIFSECESIGYILFYAVSVLLFLWVTLKSKFEWAVTHKITPNYRSQTTTYLHWSVLSKSTILLRLDNVIPR